MSWHYGGKRSLYLENLVTLHPPEQVKDDFSTHYEPLHEISVDSEDECDAADRAKAIAQVLGPCSFRGGLCADPLLRAPGLMKQTRSCPAVATLSGHAWWWAGGASGREAAGAEPGREARGEAGAAGGPGS
eukprot:COSAG01_NODE_2162_length_8259_cov_2.289371_10_plen_131_part_00